MTIEIDLRQVVYALSDALDLVGVDDAYHGKRVAMMSVEFGRALALPDDDLECLFDAGLLHDCGVSNTDVHHHLIQEMQWRQVYEHCERGWALLQSFPPLSHLSTIILCHHTHWDALSKLGMDKNTALLSNLIFLADRIDSLAAPHYKEQDLLSAREAIRTAIKALSGTWFSPELVDAFLEVSRSEAFWFSLEPRHIEHFLSDMSQRRHMRFLSLAQLKMMAMVFSRIVDAKSAFTVEHSLGVSKLARLLGEYCHLDDKTCDKLEIAGLLHDIGKLRIPDEILEKPGPLDREESEAMARHSFESYQILRSIPGLEDIAAWAAYHHESPDGSGYPFHHGGKALCLEARIIAIADFFQALAQNRPYRRSLKAEDILPRLLEQGKTGHLDENLAHLIEKNLDACWNAATQSGNELDRQN